MTRQKRDFYIHLLRYFQPYAKSYHLQAALCKRHLEELQKERFNELSTAHPVFLHTGKTNLLFGVLKLKRVLGIRKLLLFAFENETNSGHFCKL